MRLSSALPDRDASRPCRRVSPTLAKNPSLDCAPPVAWNVMSLVLVVRNTPAFQLVLPNHPLAKLPRRPASQFFATTCSSGGSATNSFGSLHGASGLEHANSTAVGARVDSL